MLTVSSCVANRMKDPVLFPFGAGLEYTEFTFTWSDGDSSNPQQLQIPSTGAAELTALSVEHVVVVTNIGKRASPVVVLAFIVATPHSPANTPAKKLFGFERLQNVGAGANTTVHFSTSAANLGVVGTTGANMLMAGRYRIEIGSVGAPASREIELRGTDAVVEDNAWVGWLARGEIQ